MSVVAVQRMVPYSLHINVTVSNFCKKGGFFDKKLKLYLFLNIHTKYWYLEIYSQKDQDSEYLYVLILILQEFRA